MVKVGRRFFFNQTFQKKQRRITIITIVCIVLAIIITFGVTSYFHDNSNERAKLDYKLKEEYKVEIFSVMPSYLNYFEKIENVPLDSISIEYDNQFTYDENGDKCSDEQLNLIREIRNGHAKAEDYDDPFACLSFVPNKVGSYRVKVTIGKEENEMVLNVVDSVPPEFEAHDLTITNEETYDAAKFISECEDNSKTDCIFDFYLPLRGEIIDYSKYKDPGTYEIKVVAKDQSGNISEPKTVTLTIKKVNYYTVTFNSNGGSSIESQTVREGTKIYSPYPEKSGYSFEGWYQGNTKYNFDNPVNSDITLTAKWKSTSSGSSGSGSSGSGSSGSGSSGSGSSGSSSGSKCKYGKYKDYYGSVSIYANLVTGKSLDDCAEKSNGEDEDYNLLREYVLEIAYDLTRRNQGAIDLDFQSLVGKQAQINHQIHTTQITKSGGFVGLLVTIDSSANGYSQTYTLYDCTLSSCRWK